MMCFYVFVSAFDRFWIIKISATCLNFCSTDSLHLNIDLVIFKAYSDEEGLFPFNNPKTIYLIFKEQSRLIILKPFIKNNISKIIYQNIN